MTPWRGGCVARSASTTIRSPILALTAPPCRSSTAKIQQADGKKSPSGGAGLGALAAAALAPEGQRAGESGDSDREQRLVRAAAFDRRRGALRLAPGDALAELPDAPTENGVAGVDRLEVVRSDARGRQRADLAVDPAVRAGRMRARHRRPAVVAPTRLDRGPAERLEIGRGRLVVEARRHGRGRD